MKIYDFKKLEKCFVCGNIDKNIDKFIQILTSNLSKYEKVEHPKELERQERLKNREQNFGGLGAVYGHAQRAIRRNRFEDDLRASMKKALNKAFSKNGGYNDSVIIVSGNCGIGAKSISYYNETFGKLNNVLRDNNCVLLFVRGNNDDPSFFNESKIDFSNIKTIPDYSVILLKSFNCLCIGGSVSLDKEWKLSQEELFGKKLFWENEQPYFDEKTLDEILKKYQIGCVITSTSPSFAFPGTNAFNNSKWVKDNKNIKSTFSSERKILDKIYDKIIDAETKPYVWIYGRFKQHNHTKVNDIVFDSLASYQIEDVRNLISSYFGIDASKKLGGNVFTFDTFICDKEQEMPRMPRHLDEPMEAENVEGEDEEMFADDAEEVDEVFNTVEDEAAPLYFNPNEVPYRVEVNQIERAAEELRHTAEAVTATNRVQIRWEPVGLDWNTIANVGDTPHV